MIIIKLQGGLGNQLFQYAAYSKLSERSEVYFDIGEYNLPKNDGYRKYYLNFFKQNSKIKLCTFNDSRKNNLIYKITMPSLKVFSNSIRNSLTYMNIEAGNSLSDDLSEIKDNSYVEGYFMDERFFTESFINSISLTDKIQKVFSKNNYLSLIQKTNSIAVHIRRTDYINHPNFKGICTSEYYKKAISFFNQKYPDSNFFFFSDDIDWAKNEFGIKPNHIFVEDEISNDATLRDLYLMCCCRHIIIANSSFSWWAAYLINNKDKIVIHPEKYQNIQFAKFYCSSWLNISLI
ncbi:MAG: alpha-1,2-fucosyltransferase [Treponema sp.]|nr:alpha-1,2-fucosyltransferase [Candidatus Treponema merdequi]